MAESDLMAVLAMVVVAVLWWPSPVAPRARLRAGTSDEVEWLTQLSVRLLGADTLDAAAVAVPQAATSWPSNLRLQQLQRLNREFGLPVAEPIGLLIDDAKGRAELGRRWAEQASGSEVSSWLLALLPIAMLGLGQAAGRSPVNWLLTPLGWTVAVLFAALTTSSRRLLARMRSNALSPVSRSGGVAFTARTAVAAVFVVANLFAPGFVGIAIGLVATGLIQRNWQRLQRGAELQAAADRRRDRAWFAIVLSALLAAGVSWVESVSALQSLVAEADRPLLEEVCRRLEWGVAPTAAFAAAGADWQQLAVTLQQTAEAGLPIRHGLAQLANHWQHELQSERIARVERAAARSVLPVSLLQLPAFLIGGVLPMLAASILPLIGPLLSTVS